MFAESVRAQLSQGDLYLAGWTEGADALVVLSNDCDIDKADTVLAVRVVSDNATAPSLLGDIKRGRVFHALYLEGLPDGGWANLRTIWPISRAVLLDSLPRRSFSMSDDGRIALAAKVFGFLTRSLPPLPPLPAAPY